MNLLRFLIFRLSYSARKSSRKQNNHGIIFFFSFYFDRKDFEKAP